VKKLVAFFVASVVVHLRRSRVKCCAEHSHTFRTEWSQSHL